MIGLYALKPWYTRRLTPILNTAVAHNVSPDVFTAAGVVAAGAAGVTIALGWWPLAGADPTLGPTAGGRCCAIVSTSARYAVASPARPATTGWS
jgi:hypothetical protein